MLSPVSAATVSHQTKQLKRVARSKLFVKLIVVGASDERLEANLTHLLMGSKTITGEIVGTAIDEDDTLDFSVLQGIRPMVETIPLEEAQAGYDKMMRNEARFRIVLTMN